MLVSGLGKKGEGLVKLRNQMEKYLPSPTVLEKKSYYQNSCM